MKVQRWTRKLVEREKQFVRNELTGVREPRERLKKALTKLRQNNETEEETSYLKSFLYGVYALLAYLEAGSGLSLKEVDRLAEHCSLILRVHGVAPGTSRLSDLYWNLHSVLGQVYRQAGLAWTAAVEQHLSTVIGAPEPRPGELGFPQLSAGISNLRLGNAELALRCIEEAMQAGLSPSAACRGHLEKTRALRLSGHPTEASRLATSLLDDKNILNTYRREFEWEIICAGVMQTNDLTPLFSVTRTKGTHYEASYVLEAFLWSRIAKETKWLERFPRVGGRKKARRLEMSSAPLYVRCARGVEELYDERSPLTRRLESLPKLMESARLLRTIDKELLVWAAVSRWLARERQYSLAATFLSQYRALSFQLSTGKSNDVLGMLGDLLDAFWFTGAAAKVVPFKKAA